MKDKILAMEAGILLDSLIVEDVMGWKERVDFDIVDGIIARYIPNTNDVEQFSPSTDISTAWEIVVKMEKRIDGAWMHLHQDESKWWGCTFDNNKNEGIASEAPEAICKAALLAVMEETKCEK